MKYELIQPPVYLRSYVRFFWTLEGDAMDALSKVFGSLVDGSPGMIFQQTEGGAFVRDDKALPEIFLYGQTTKHTEIAALGEFRSAGVIFHPNALKSVFGLNAGDLTNSCVDLNLVSSPKKCYLSEKLLQSTSIDNQIEILSSYLHSQISNSHVPVDGIIEYAVSRIMTSNGSVPLKELLEKLHMTERTFERKFKEYVGISPKLFSRICRFQASLQQLKNNKYTRLSDIAFENDYADQSHFIRSFKEFTGCSPFQFQKQQQDAADSNTPVLIK
ncbi:AraC family transcriptional regulator [Chitinophaga sp. Mgbs1]|uniref:AraC family transcriptional regulator n=1 Tax=Chitinophaga solisilvae TaxID=1233460 RepID=A0A3S1AY93_9BACT|nr:AraC family transcriptional regulator [Chitinophaga solisilvae]